MYMYVTHTCFVIINYCSSGFGVVSSEDDVVTDDKGNKRKINCGTEKGKHKSKNHRTAGTCITIKTPNFNKAHVAKGYIFNKYQSYSNRAAIPFKQINNMETYYRYILINCMKAIHANVAR